MKDRKVYELTYPAQPVGPDTTTAEQKVIEIKGATRTNFCSKTTKKYLNIWSNIRYHMIST